MSAEDIARAWVRTFSDDEVRELADAVEAAHDADQAVLPVYISSTGGSIYNLMAMIDLVRACRMPVATIAIGTAQSSAADLLAAGTKGHRYVSPSISVMVHDVASSMTRQKVASLESEIAQLRIERDRTFDLFAKHTGRTRRFWERWLAKHHGRDGWLTASEAVAMGIADHVKVPVLGLKGTRKVACE